MCSRETTPTTEQYLLILYVPLLYIPIGYPICSVYVLLICSIKPSYCFRRQAIPIGSIGHTIGSTHPICSHWPFYIEPGDRAPTKDPSQARVPEIGPMEGTQPWSAHFGSRWMDGVGVGSDLRSKERCRTQLTPREGTPQLPGERR